MTTEVRSLLIVDDNPGDRYVVEYMLGKTGRFKHVYWAADGQEALDLFEQYEASRAAHPERFPPCVILLDINMPRLGGFELLERMHALQLDAIPTVVLMLTSSTLDIDIERANRDPLVAGFFVKPLTVVDAHGIADRYGT